MKSRAISIGLFSILLILIIVIGVAYWWQTNHQKEQANNSDNQSQPTITPPPTVTPIIAGQDGSIAQACAGDQLQLKVAPAKGGAAAGSVEYQIALTNSSQQPCRLIGYPGVSLLDKNSKQVGQPAERDNQVDSQIITLKPQQSATADLHVVRDYFDPGTCQQGATQIQVIPPNTTTKLTAEIDSDSPLSVWCPGFTIRPMQSE